LSRAAKQFDVARSELVEFMKDHFELQAVAYEIHEELIDMAEAQLLAEAHKGTQWAIDFRLQYFSQRRGYSKYPRPPANPNSSPYDPPPWFNWDWNKLDNDQLEQLRQIAENLGIDPRKPPNPYSDPPNPSPKQPVSRDAESSERSAEPNPSPKCGGEEETPVNRDAKSSERSAERTLSEPAP
jgi:hypothetical protein